MSPSSLAVPSRAIAGATARLVLIALAVAVAFVALTAASAFAADTRPLTASFGTSGTSATSFTAPEALAFDQANDRLYALDQGDSSVHGFDASTPGAFTPLAGNFPLAVSLSFAGLEDDLAVDSASHDLYYVSEAGGALYGFDSAGDPLGGNFPVSGFGDPCGAAVDPAGHVWVGDFATQKVHEYDSSGNLLGSVDASAQGFPCHIAFNSAGDLYVALYFDATWKYTAASGYTDATKVDPSSTNAIAVDRSTDTLYVAHSNHVVAYDDAGAHLYDFGTTISGPDFEGIAVNESTDEVYVSDAINAKVHVFGQPVPLPDPFTQDVDAITDTAATARGTVDPSGEQLTDCHFDVVPAAQFAVDQFLSVTPAQQTPCVPDAASIPADSSAHAVGAGLTGLTPGTTYHVRLVAASVEGTAEGRGVNFTTAIGAPAITSQSLSSADVNEATIAAKINPKGAATTYHVDYGTSAAYGQSTAEHAPIGSSSDDSDHAVAVTLPGLAPGTTYHFRFVATNSVGATPGPDATFTTYAAATSFVPCPNDAVRTGPGSRLPDCRAYEQSTPVAKNGNDPRGGDDYVQAAEDGTAITYVVQGGGPGGVGAQDFPSFMVRRGAGAWSSAGLLPPAALADNASVKGWTRDLSRSFTAAFSGSPSNGLAFLDRDSADGSVASVAPFATSVTDYFYVGASRDDSKVYFEARGALTADSAPAPNTNLYVWDRDTDSVNLVGLLPGEITPPAGSFAGPYQVGTFDNPDVGGGGTLAYTQDNHAISDDGDSAFFTAAGAAQLYLRTDATGPGASTVRVSESQKVNGSGPGGTDPNGPQPAAFRVATPDASTVLFTSPEELTDDATTGTADQGNDLYAYDTASGELTDLAPDPGDANGADVQGVVGMSDDASYIYFVANGVLAAGAAPGDCQGGDSTATGSCSLYLWRDGDITFIAPLSANTGPGDSSTDATNWQTSSNFSNGGASESTGRVTPDGRTLLFRSKRQLTAYDNTSGCGNGGAFPCSELYRYRVGEPVLTCVSCNPTGAPPVASAGVRSISLAVRGGSVAASRTRNLSADGDRAFFETSDKLVAADTNGDVRCEQGSNINGLSGSTCQDVYEWEADGSGSCDTPGGCLYLISSGRSPQAAFFADASLSGDDAFFFTIDKLVPSDEDGNVDIYDARVGGGLAAQHQTPPDDCSGDACRGGLTPPPVLPTAATVTFTGSGNASSPRGSGRVSVARHKPIVGFAARLRVKAPAAGVIRVSGASVVKATRKAGRAGSYTITVRLTAKARRKLGKRSAHKVRVRVGFKPKSGSASAATISLTFKAPRHRRARTAATTRRAGL